METTPQAQLAVLIDADNANAKRIDGLLAEVAKYGRATTKRAYGDWTNTHLGSWKQTLARHAIQPMQQFSNTRGKNSTDSALIIDAMDLLYTERFDGFCIVSSDSDFTRLASRIREAGLTVYGFGERKTPQPFVRACDRFIYVEVLGQTEGEDDTAAEPVAAPPTGERRTIQNGRRPQPAPVAQQAAAARPAAPVADKPADAGNSGQGAGDRRHAVPRGAPLDDPALLNPLRAAVADACDDDGWAELGAVGSLLSKRMPEFDPRNYGRKKLSDLFAAIAIFEVNERAETGRSRTLFVREKRDRNGGEPAVGARAEAAAAGDGATPSAAVTAVEPKAEGAGPSPRPSAPPAAPRPPQPPRPPQGGKPQQQAPRPALQGLPAEPTDEELKALAGAGWAPRRDDRRPTWAVTPVPILPAAATEPPPAAAPVAALPAEPVTAAPAVPVAAPVVQPIVEVAAEAPADATPAAAPAAGATEAAPRKPAAKKATATKPVSKAITEAATKGVTKAVTKAATKAASKAAPAPDAAEAPKRRSRKPASAD